MKYANLPFNGHHYRIFLTKMKILVTLIQLDMLESNQDRDLPPVHTLHPSQGQETATDTTPQDQIDVTASVSEPNHENISENLDVVQNVNHEQADTVQIPPEFDNELFMMSESEMHEFINGQQRWIHCWQILY
jgi:hypothetical protein